MSPVNNSTNNGASLHRHLARWMRRLADRIDPDGAPRYTGYGFTFEPRRGIQFHADGRGCPLWYLGKADYERAHTERITKPIV